MENLARINEQAPDFWLPGVLDGTVEHYSLAQYRGTWVVLFFYPADFSFVCPTEVKGFNDIYQDLVDAHAEVLGVSTDSVESHMAWAQEMGGVKYPLLSDESKQVCRHYNALDTNSGVALRATFIVNPERVVQYASVTHNNVGRSVEETFRVLTALRTGRMCPADWKPGNRTFDTAMKY